MRVPPALPPARRSWRLAERRTWLWAATVAFTVRALLAVSEADQCPVRGAATNSAVAVMDIQGSLAKAADRMSGFTGAFPPEPHILALADASKDVKLRGQLETALASLVCGDGTAGRRQSLSGKTEAHAAQALLAIASAYEMERPVAGECGGRTVRRLVEREIVNPAYGKARAYIDGALAMRLAQMPRVSPRNEDLEAFRQRQAVRNDLAALDLSWFIQAVVLVHAGDGRLADVEWQDSASQRQALTALIASQLRYVNLGAARPDLSFVPELGVHTLAMLELVTQVFAREESARTYLRRYQGERDALRERLLATVQQSPPTDPTSRLLLAHLLQIDSCRLWREGLGLASPRVQQGATLGLAPVLLDAVRDEDATSVTFMAHAFWAMSNLDAWIRQLPPPPIRRCVVF